MNNSCHKWSATVALRYLALSFVVVVASFSTALSQTTTFAQFSQTIATNDFTFSNLGTSGNLSTIPGGVPVNFSYSNIVGLPAELTGPQAAHLTITTGSTNQPGFNGSGFDFQPFNQTVTVVISRDTPASPGTGGGTRTNLLTAVFSPAGQTPAAVGLSGGQSATLSASTPGNVVTFTSHFLSFASTNARNLGLSFSSVNPAYVLSGNSFLASFTAAGTGTFASNPVPVYAPPSAGDVSVGGRVNARGGRGLVNATVRLLQDDGSMLVTRTSSFGYFQFKGVRSGQAVLIMVESRNYTYEPQFVSLADNALELRFDPN